MSGLICPIDIDSLQVCYILDSQISTIARKKDNFISFNFHFPHDQLFQVETEMCGKCKFLTLPHSESGSGVFASLLIYDSIRITEMEEAGYVGRLEVILILAVQVFQLGFTKISETLSKIYGTVQNLCSFGSLIRYNVTAMQFITGLR